MTALILAGASVVFGVGMAWLAVAWQRRQDAADRKAITRARLDQILVRNDEFKRFLAQRKAS